MITGELKSKVDQVWLTFHSGGISNPISVIEQLTYLLFIKRLDELQFRKEEQATLLGNEIESPIFTSEQKRLRWSQFKDLEAREMYEVVSSEVFPFIKNLSNDKEDSTFAMHMKDAMFMIPPEKAGLLAKVVEMVESFPTEDKDTKGDLYEYMLSKLSTAGDGGQFRTPRHLIRMMVEMTKPTAKDIICDPACGTAGFLAAVAEYFNKPENRSLFHDPEVKMHYETAMFNGFDFDSTMLRIASMNMMMHGLSNPNIRNKDSLSEDHGADEEVYSLILANPPFAGSLDYDSCSKDLQVMVKTKKTELLFLALFMKLLQKGGRAAVIVPDGVLFGSSNAHQDVRKMIVETNKLDAVVSLPSGVFKPYAGVKTAILFFTKTTTGGTDNVWFYDMQADGFSLDDRRTELDRSKHENCNIADILNRWKSLDAETDRKRTDQSFMVPFDEIKENGFDLSINRYKEVVYEEVKYDSPEVILKEINDLEAEIQSGLKELEGMLNHE